MPEPSLKRRQRRGHAGVEGHRFVRLQHNEPEAPPSPIQSALAPSTQHIHDWMHLSGGWKWCGGCGDLTDPEGYHLLPSDRLYSPLDPD